MAFLKNKWAMVAVIFASLSLVTSLLAGHYWLQYTDLLNRFGGVVIQANLGVDYGNGTRIWSNKTKTISGATLFDMTKQSFNVTYNVGLYGTEVTAISNVTKQGSFGWTYWVWNSTGTEPSWSIVWANADTYRVADKETYLWSYQDNFNPPD